MTEFNHNEPFSNRLNLEVRISINTAKLAKEAGFEVGTKGMFTEYITERVNDQDGTSGPFGWKKGELVFDSRYFVNNSEHDYSNDDYISYALPTQAELQRWLRDTHNIHIRMFRNEDGLDMYSWVMDSPLMTNNPFYDEYEDALEDGLQKSLLILKKVEVNE